MSRRRTGQLAEQYVADALVARGWRILARNLRTPCAEMDLLAEDPQGELVLIEVKARTPLAFLQGEEHVGARQRQRLERALEWLARRQPRSRSLRIDLAIVFQRGGEVLNWELLEGITRIESAQGRGGELGG